jgi:hypothetical protein
MTRPPNYTTSVAPEKTAAECVVLLGRYGAAQVTLYFSEGRAPTGLTFVIDSGRGQSAYKIAADVTRIHAALGRDASVPRRHSGLDQARRTAWKTIQGWLEFQLTMIETGLMDPEQVLLPYAVNDQGRTMWEVAAERRSIAAGTVVDR